MNRRKFLAYLSGTAAGAALAPMLDLDRLLWVPGAKTIFIPEPFTCGNTFIAPDWVVQETLRMFKNNLRFVKQIHHDYDALWTGATVTVPMRHA